MTLMFQAVGIHHESRISNPDNEFADRVPGRGVRSGRWVIVSGKLERVSLQPLAG